VHSLRLLLLAALAASVVAAASLSGAASASGAVTCSMNSTSFVALQATVPNPAVVKLTCPIPAGDVTVVTTGKNGIVLFRQEWTAEYSSVLEWTVDMLVAPHTVTPGSYRATVTVGADSASVAFTVLPKNTVLKLPKAGFWTGASSVSFYVTPDQKHITHLTWAYTADSTGPGQSCSATGTLTQKAPVAITGPAYGRLFEIKTPFFTGGHFDTPTRASGGNEAFSVSVGCGSGTGFAKNLFVVTWKNASQPKGK